MMAGKAELGLIFTIIYFEQFMLLITRASKHLCFIYK